MSQIYAAAMLRANELAKQGLGLTAPNPIVGAVIIDEFGREVSSGFHLNSGSVLDKDSQINSEAGDHAEIVAIKAAARSLGSWRLEECTLVVTLEPCAMCAGAIMQARIPRVVFGAWDEKAGAAGSMWDLLRDPRALHKVEVISDVLKDECAALLKEFFSEQR